MPKKTHPHIPEPRLNNADVLHALREGQVDAIVGDEKVFILKPHSTPANRTAARVFVVEDHEIVISGIIKLIEEDPEYVVAGCETDSTAAMERIAAAQPDILIIDISMPHVSGMELALAVRQSFPGIKIIMYTMYDNEEYSLPVFKAGIEGYVLKSEPFSELKRAIGIVQSGGMYYSGAVSTAVRKQLDEVHTEKHEQVNRLSVLSSREREVFPLLADGLSVHKIGEQLFISPKTVETHKYNILEKLGVESIAELTKIAIKEGIIDLSD